MQGDNLMCAAKAEQELRQKKRYLTRVRTRNQRIGRWPWLRKRVWSRQNLAAAIR